MKQSDLYLINASIFTVGIGCANNIFFEILFVVAMIVWIILSITLRMKGG